MSGDPFLELVAAWRANDAAWSASATGPEVDAAMMRAASLEYRISRTKPTTVAGALAALEWLAAYACADTACHLDHIALAVLDGARQALATMSERVPA
jgi:hypothetical protein